MTSPGEMTSSGVRRVLWITLGLNVVVSVAKIVVGKLSGSMAMVADGYHSLTDGANNVAGLVITGFAYAPPDEGHPYGHSILGTRETVGAMQADTLARIHRERYVGSNLVVAAAGNVQHAPFLEAVERLFGGVAQGKRDDGVPPLPQAGRGDVRIARPGAQTHLVFGTDAPPHADPRRYPLVLLSSALGGGMSSRLFQRIREELALAYTVYSFQSFYALGGLTGVYVGTRPSWERRAVEAVREELARVAKEGLPPDELEQTKRQVKGQIMLSLESTGARLYRLAGFALYEEPFLDLDELLARIDAVSGEEVAAAAATFYDPDRQLLLRLGPESE